MTPLAQGYYMRWLSSDPWRVCEEVTLAHIVGSTKARLTHELLYVDSDGVEHYTGAGLLTDGGSKPRWSWLWFGHPYDPRFLRAYVTHDGACDRARWVFKMDADRGRLLRLHADRTFRNGVLWLGAGWWRAASYYRAVRCGAWWEMGG